jgi:hypothetical protein
MNRGHLTPEPRPFEHPRFTKRVLVSMEGELARPPFQTRRQWTRARPLPGARVIVFAGIFLAGACTKETTEKELDAEGGYLHRSELGYQLRLPDGWTPDDPKTLSLPQIFSARRARSSLTEPVAPRVVVTWEVEPELDDQGLVRKIIKDFKDLESTGKIKIDSAVSRLRYRKEGVLPELDIIYRTLPGEPKKGYKVVHRALLVPGLNAPEHAMLLSITASYVYSDDTVLADEISRIFASVELRTPSPSSHPQAAEETSP